LYLLGSFSNVTDADIFLNSNDVDLIFLDIQMPMITGLDFLRINRNLPMVIITTAYPDYALQGFEYDVIDYLTKPIRFERFYKAVSKCRKLLATSKDIKSEAIEQSKNDVIFIRSNRKNIRVIMSKISHIEALKDYVLVHYETERIPVSINLKSIESKLPKDKFIRVSKSMIVNIDFVKSIENDLIELKNLEISIGEHYKDTVQNFIQNIGIIKRDY
jgi:DNA-binding LytR/AlgR family response regulator